jgi:FAD/FMN-containing dehydrogenase
MAEIIPYHELRSRQREETPTPPDNQVRFAPSSLAEAVDGLTGLWREGVPTRVANWVCDGPPGDRSVATVSLRGLDRIIRLDRANLALIAEAGVTVGSLRQALDGAGLWCPALRWLPTDETIGSSVAGGHGRRSRGYGVVADYLLGLQFLCPATGLARHGGLAIKNATGYNLSRCVAGSRGHLAVVLEVTLRLIPLPPDYVVRRYRCHSLVEAWHFASGVARAGSASSPDPRPDFKPVAVELWTGLAGGSADLLVEAEGTAAHVERSLDILDPGSAVNDGIELVATDRWPPARPGWRVARRLATAPSRVRAALDSFRLESGTAADRLAVLGELTGGAVELWANPFAFSQSGQFARPPGGDRQPPSTQAGSDAFARALKVAFDPGGLLHGDDALGSYEVLP